MVFSIIKTREKLEKIEVVLRPLEIGDKARVCQWMNDPYVIEHSFVVPGPSSLPADFYTVGYAYRYFDLLLSDNARATYAILYKNTHVGNIGFKDISLEHRHAECFIEIGERKLRGRGIGRRAMQNLIMLGHESFGLKFIELEVLEFNFAAINLYEKLGFRKLGVNSWHYDAFGIYWQVFRMRLCL